MNRTKTTQEAKQEAGDALHSVLSVFHDVQGQRLDSVHRSTTSTSSVSAITLRFGQSLLSIVVDSEDDSIDLIPSFPKGSVGKIEDVTNSSPWHVYVHKEFYWGWVTINQQGYADGVLLSFDTIKPTLLLNVIAASLKVATISKLKNV